MTESQPESDQAIDRSSEPAAQATPENGTSGSPAPHRIDADTARANARSGLFLGFVAVAVLALAPVLYYGGSYLCTQLGIGVNPNQAAVIEAAEDDNRSPSDRKVRVTFGAQVNDNLPVRFFPEERQQGVMLGEKVYNTYHFKNTSPDTVRFRPIHSVSPPDANRVYAMTVCFCFNDQEIEPFGERSYEIEYILGEDLDRRVSSVQVNYSLHFITKDEMKPHVEGETMKKGPSQDAAAAPTGQPAVGEEPAS